MDRRSLAQQILDKRGAAYSTPLHQAAFAIDPRVISLLQEPNADDIIGFELRRHWQHAVSVASNEYMEHFFSTEAGLSQTKTPEMNA